MFLSIDITVIPSALNCGLSPRLSDSYLPIAPQLTVVIKAGYPVMVNGQVRNGT